MSLSFVSSAVLSSSDGVSHNEERQIESKEVQALRSKGTQAKPLFDQLREKKEAEDAEREEFQRSIMRGTLALDEEDCAHLDTLSKHRREREATLKADTEQELAFFRAARAERQQGKVVVEEEEEQDTKPASIPVAKQSSQHEKPKAQIMPKIMVKRRRRKDSKEELGENKKLKSEKQTADGDDEHNKTETDNKQKEEEGLVGLLGDYGSSDDDSD